MLSDISWSNRGNDGFNTLFGANANLARQIVDRAIVDWETVIVSFNNLPGQGTFNLTVEAVDIDSIAGAFITSTSSGKPRSATIQVDSAGTMHYLDPTPADDAEFDDNLTNAFTDYAITPAISGVDFYATMVHELGHALGFSFTRADLAIQSFLTNTGIDDPNTADAGNLVAFNVNGGPIEATFTAADTGHLWEGPGTTATNNAGLPWHPEMLMNPGRAISSNERNLISNGEASILRDAYGYTVQMPSTINNMLVNPNYSNDVLTVRGMNGNVNDTFIVQGDFDPNRLHVTVGSYTETVPLAEVGTIVVNGLNGDDLFQLEYAANRFTTYNGGNGVDTIDLGFATRNLNNIGGPTLFNGGPGADFMHLYDNNYTAADLWSIDEDSLTRFGTGIQQYDSQVENVFLTTGTNHNPISIPRTRAGCKIYLNSSGGQDLVNIGLTAQGTANILGEIEIQNDPNFTTINIDDTGRAVSRFPLFELFGQFGWVSRFAGADFSTGPTIFWDNADVQEIHITTGGGDDGVEVRQCSERLFIDNSGGRDNVSIGNGSNGLQQITQQIDIEPTPSGVFSTLTLDDAASTIPRSPTWSASGADMLVSGLAPMQIRYDAAAVDTFTMLGGFGNDTFVIAAGTYNDATTIDVGGGSDQVFVNGARMASLTLRGGTDSVFDFLDIDDRTLPGNVIGGQVYADRIDREMFPTQASQVFYSGFASIDWYQQPNQNSIQVYGTPSDIAPNFLFSIIGNSLDDLVDVYVRDAQGNQTISGNLYFTGGGGPDWLQVISASAAESFRFLNQFGGSTTYIGGAGPGWIAAVPDVENVYVNGSTANDTFAVDQFTSGCALTIRGGNGNDNCTIGNGDMAANLTSASAFTFDGQAGSDRFTISNGVTNTAWTYGATTGALVASRSSPTSYSWQSNLQAIESQYVFAGSAADTFNIDSTAQSVYTEFNGFAGVDTFRAGFTNTRVNDIHGPIAYNAGADGGTLSVSNAGGFPATAHQTATTIGAYLGDNLFGSGGSLTFSGVTNSGGTPGVGVGLASNSTIYAQPLSTSQVSVSSGFLFQSPSGSLKLATAGVQNPVVNGNSGSGSLTSSNRQTLSWTNFTGAIQTDAVAPTVANINFKLGAGAGPSLQTQTLRVTFSEAIGSVITPDFLSLFNATTGTQIPSSIIAVSYDAPTLTATFTFPGYAGGVLPNGTYQAQILAGLGDAFGNSMPASSMHTFIWAAGTSSNDTFRVKRAANFSDLNVFFNNDATPAFVAGPTTAQVVLAGDTGNDSFIVDLTNLDPTPVTGGIVFDGNEGTNSVLVKGGPNVEGVTFFSNYIAPGANNVDLTNIQTRQFDGGGGYDSLGVYVTTVMLPTSQRFGALGIDQDGTVIMQPGLNGLLITKSLSILSNSTLDLNDSDMIVDYTGASQLANVVAAIKNARNGGAWNGSGITSTTAKNNAQHNTTLGAIEGTDFKAVYGAAAPFDGEPVDNTSVLVKYTYYGDTDFNGKVDGADYARIDAKFNQQVTSGNIGGWFNGDADYNGKIDGADYALIDAAFNSQGAPLRPALSSPALPATGRLVR